MEHFTWNNGYDEINKLEIQGTYDQFIGSYVCDEILPVCDTIIENMDFCEMVGLTRKRRGLKTEVEDEQFHLHQKGYHLPDPEMNALEKYDCAEAFLNVCNREYISYINGCKHFYAQKFDILGTYDINIFGVKIQKIKAGQGFHGWHAESSVRDVGQRCLTFMTYLNDDFEGGETEFLYQKKRVKPVKGKTILWPAGFDHTHRGGLVLEGTKYIATGWFEFGFD